ncbi:MAG: CHAP domain-containing protein [Rhodospirillales bacterium]|nr:CHAP domain-containing protein [Rhodospirillales bacterium]MDH3911026.1 CHAP domain-containing protein [Rhodospirillales bacterium]MDH3917535.1 CHAP domain-containing protein [Rhodospirillales bacterium]MDH3968170.1 CHAP domain-containing protein [Rhodospirillales bacterium]
MPPATGPGRSPRGRSRPGAAAFWRRPLLPGLCLAMTACSGPTQTPEPYAYVAAPALSIEIPAAPPVPPPPPPSPRTQAPAPTLAALRRAGPAPPRIVKPPRPLQCVPYARRLSGIGIRGDAWTWWRQASGRYKRSRRPAVGAVLVISRAGRSLGHLAVVVRVVGDREIVVSHANWLNRGLIHENAPIKDVSLWGNWSAVKVWYTPGNHYGGRTYPAHGFIHPAVSAAAR